MKPIRPNENFLIFGSPAIEQPEIDEVMDCFKRSWLGTGPKVAKFEEDFCGYIGAPNATAVNSCTAALHLSLIASGVGPGDEVITTPMTFCATANAIIHAGAMPVLADVDPQTMNLDPREVAKKITPKTRAILPVHFAGRPCDMPALVALAEKHGLKIIEDCAHAIETQIGEKHAGTFGDFGCFSFYVTKNIITGEGGMVVTKREEDAARIKMLALHGMSKDAWKRFSDEGYKHYQVVECGFKYNMMDVQAAIGIHQLRRIETYWRRRTELWARYNEAFAKLPITLPAPAAPGTRHAFHLYSIFVDESRCGISRDAFLDGMTRHNIGVGVHYLSLPEHPYYQRTFGWRAGDFPNAMKIGQQTASLPLSAKLTDDDVADVIAAVRQLCGNFQ